MRYVNHPRYGNELATLLQMLRATSTEPRKWDSINRCYVPADWKWDSINRVYVPSNWVWNSLKQRYE